MALQQVDVRFPTESQILWEARGAAVAGHFRDYSSAMKARFCSPYQDDWEWKQFGKSYTQLLALLQLDAKLLQEIWPQDSGGEAAYRRHWKLKVKLWAKTAQQQSKRIASAMTQAGSLPHDEAATQYQSETILHAKIHWNFMHDAMLKMCSPTVVMAASEAAIRTTAQLWDFKPTTAVEAVTAKVEERLPLTFGKSHSMHAHRGQCQAMYKILQVMSAGATDAIWRHMKQSRVHDTSTSLCLSEVTGKFSDMGQATAA